MPTDLLQIFSPKNVILFIVVFTRLGGLMASAPIFSTYPIPAQIKAWFLASVTFIIYPFILAKSGFVMPNTMPELTMILLKEFAIGYVIGYCSNLIFIGVEMAANLISMQTALSASQALDPLTGTQSSVLDRMYVLMIAMIFLGLNAHHWMFGAICKSFESVPVGYSFIFTGELVQQVLFMCGQIFAISLSIALPIFAVLLISDVLFGLLSKMMPQMNIFMVAMPLKIYLGLFLVIMLMKPTVTYMAVLLEKFMTAMMAVF